MTVQSVLNVNKAQGNSESPFWSSLERKSRINTSIPNAVNEVPGLSRSIRVKVLLLGMSARSLSKLRGAGYVEGSLKEKPLQVLLV